MGRIETRALEPAAARRTLTFREPIRLGYFVCFPKVFTPLDAVWALVQDAVLVAVAQNAEDLVVDFLVALELLVRLEVAGRVVRVALVDAGHATELLVIPRIVLLVRRNDRLCVEVRNYYVIRVASVRKEKKFVPFSSPNPAPIKAATFDGGLRSFSSSGKLEDAHL